MEQQSTEACLKQLRELSLRGLASFDFEAILEQHYRHWVQAGDTVIDVGAHVGRHLGPLLDCVGPGGKAIAFEPLPFAFHTLEDRFKDTGVVLHNVALSNRIGESDFTYARGTPEESGLRQRQYNRPDAANPTQIKVRVDSLDRCVAGLTELSFIKIDVEGGEIDCLEGSRATLAKFRPVVSVEYGKPSYSAYGNTQDTLFELAQSCDYALLDIFLNPLDRIEEWRLACDCVCWDFLMVPRERRGEFVARVYSRAHYALETPKANSEGEIASLQARVRQLEGEVAAYQNSASWKVTAPIRAMVKPFRT